MDSFIVSLFGARFGLQTSCHGWARFRLGRLVDGTPAVRNAFALRAAHFDQVGF